MFSLTPESLLLLFLEQVLYSFFSIIYPFSVEHTLLLYTLHERCIHESFANLKYFLILYIIDT